MRNRLLPVLGVLVAVAPGCAMERAAAVGAAKTAGRATVKVAEGSVKVVTWPVRKLWAMEPRHGAKPGETPPPETADTPEFSGNKVIVAGATRANDDDSADTTRVASSSSSSSSSRKKKASRNDDDEPATRMASNDDSDDDPPVNDRRVARTSQSSGSGRITEDDADPPAAEADGDDWHKAKGKVTAKIDNADDPIVIR